MESKQDAGLHASPYLDERQRRLMLAVEAAELDRGGVSSLAAATGAARTTIQEGMGELVDERAPDATREVDCRVDQALEMKTGDQRGHHQQPGVGHQVRVVEGHGDPVDSARY